MLKNIGIKNYRSFDDLGVFLENLSKVNIIIGKNNSGKSNVLRFFKILSEKVNSLHTFGSLNKIDYHSNNNSINVGFDLTHQELNWPENLIDGATIEGGPLEDYISNPFRFWFPLEMERVNKSLLPEALLALDPEQLSLLHDVNTISSKDGNLDNIASKIDTLIYNKLKFIKDIITIPDLRVINPSDSHNNGNSQINVKNIIVELFQMQVPDTGEDDKRETFDKIQSLVKDLLNIKDLVIEVPHTKDKILIKMHGKRLPLDSYGSRIYQIILLCSALVIYDNRIVCIEEPETHLHPDLQRKFLNFLVKETNNTYFITTHSNTFINYSKSVSIYHMEHDENHSIITRVENTNASYKLLDDLGYKASDIIQSNGIIWVEGPSDRNFLLKWISLLDSSVEEGLHFSIMFYGGKNLANVSFDNSTITINDILEQKLIPLLKVNRNALVLIDSDITTKRTDINSTKKRIQLEVGDDNCWITKGKEIENYISPNVVERWMKSLNVYNDSPIITKLNKSFGDTIKAFDKTKKLIYDNNKTFYSRQIATHFTNEDLDYNNLRANISNIVSLIKIWNQ